MKVEDFGKKTGSIDIPNLIENQIKSYRNFKDSMIDDVLKEIFPISDNSGNITVQYMGSRLEEPTITPEEAKMKRLTYTGNLYVDLRLINNESGEVIDSQVFQGEIPYMTDKGTFISNGSERIIVNQIVRSPGLYVTSEMNKRGKYLYEAKIIPDDGSRLLFYTNNKGAMYPKIDMIKKKIPVTLLLKALGGYTNEELLEIFDNDPFIQASLEEDTSKNQKEAVLDLFHWLKPDEPRVIERAQKYIDNLFLTPRKYDLLAVGRHKLNKKLSLRERCIGKELARPAAGFEKGYVLDEEFFEKYDDTRLWILNDNGEEVLVIGVNDGNEHLLRPEDLIATINYISNMERGIGQTDNIDHLGNRRVRLCGELLKKEFRVGMNRVEKSIREKLNTNQMGMGNATKLTPQNLINVRPLVAVLREFLGSNQLSQFVEQVNPFSELGHKRRISALGTGGFQKDRAGIEVRDVHYSHYGMMCPSETPEGANVGLITSLALYARINDYGLIESPYFKVDKKAGKVTDQLVYMSSDEQEKYYIAKADSVDKNGNFVSERLVVRKASEYPTVDKTAVDFVDVSMGQIVGLGIQMIPFLEHDDANRAVMGANMQRQAVSLVNPDRPLVGTGIERIVAKNTDSSYVAEEAGVVVDVSDTFIKVQYEKIGLKKYKIHKYQRTNADTSFTHKIKVSIGEKFEKGKVLVDSSSSVDGDIALGKNVTVAFMTWRGYNYEDAIVISEKLVKEDAYTTIMLKEYITEVRSMNGSEDELTNEPIVSKISRRHLDEEGIVKIGSYVEVNDVLVGKVTPKNQEDTSPEDKLLKQIFVLEKGKHYRDSSLKVPNGKSGIVTKVIRISKDEAELPSGVLEQIKVVVAEKRQIQEGDKMAGRHGNKGVVAIVVPEEDMPYMADGTPIGICLNPLGVPSRMNIGQVMETHLGMAAKSLEVCYRLPVFDSPTEVEIVEELKKANLAETGKVPLYDGITGEKFDNDITVGVMYIMKLAHQVDDKMHARSTGPYSLVTQQPLGGKAQMGGQRFGEMEVWALEAYGASYMLNEMLTVKSDDIIGRADLYESIVRDREMNATGQTESFKVMMKEIQSLGLDIRVMKDED